MPSRTNLTQFLPWQGGVNASLDPALIGQGELTRADNVLFDTKESKKPRNGMDFSWDDVDQSDVSIYGLHEFWYGLDARSRVFVSLNTEGELKSYTSGGVHSVISVEGAEWSEKLDQISMLTFNNRLIIAVNGDHNTVKIWDATGSAKDLKNILNQKLYSNGRSSSGLVRTLILSAAFKGVLGDRIIVSQASNGAYNGTFEVTGVSTTNVTNDTISYSATSSLTESGVNDTALTVDGIAPEASILREHLGRIWCNDKNNKDRVHYSAPFDHEKWLGYGDSGALDIGIGDGDPEGITSIMPSFKGELFIAKRTKLYRVRGFSPESFQVELVSNGIGCIAHDACTLVDQDDLYFVSDKGVHSIVATSNYGDFNSTFISQKIQRLFLNNFTKPRFKYVKAVYNSETNNVAFAFTDTNIADLTRSSFETNNCLWMYNVERKSWYRWPDVPAQSLIIGNDGDSKRFYFGTNKNKIVKTGLRIKFDYDYSGAEQPIKMTLVTGQITGDGSIYTVKGWKRLLLMYRPNARHHLNVQVKIDSIPVDSDNSHIFNETPAGSSLLGSNLVLGQSQLGSNSPLAAYTREITGFGRSVQITLVLDAVREYIDLEGIGVEWEAAGVSPETMRAS